MTNEDGQKSKLDLQKYKKLLDDADKEITLLRGHVSKCSVTIYETIMAQEDQDKEVNTLRERVAELEEILAESDEHATAAANVFTAMQVAMSHMQETIQKVSESAKKTAADTGILDKMNELQEVASSTLDDDSLAAYNRQRAALKEKIRAS